MKGSGIAPADLSVRRPEGGASCARARSRLAISMIDQRRMSPMQRHIDISSDIRIDAYTPIRAVEWIAGHLMTARPPFPAGEDDRYDFACQKPAKTPECATKTSRSTSTAACVVYARMRRSDAISLPRFRDAG